MLFLLFLLIPGMFFSLYEESTKEILACRALPTVFFLRPKDDVPNLAISRFERPKSMLSCFAVLSMTA